MRHFLAHASCAVGPCDDTGSASNDLPLWAWLTFAVIAMAVIVFVVSAIRRGR